ncbi:Iron-binding protein IscA [Serratia symbiotica]|nr:Iron-binding protein IscA [Serratia symbiotica]
MSITITDNAVKHIQNFIKKNIDLILRLSIKTSGCSGMTYVLKLVNIINKNDIIFKNKGFKIIIDKKNLIYLDGIELDFVKEGLNESFKFNNPNAINHCGCGKSFSV